LIALITNAQTPRRRPDYSRTLSIAAL